MAWSTEHERAFFAFTMQYLFFRECCRSLLHEFKKVNVVSTAGFAVKLTPNFEVNWMCGFSS
jgi:hypothetical protein